MRAVRWLSAGLRVALAGSLMHSPACVRACTGNVRYMSDNFTIKNKDTLFDDLIIVIHKSKCRFVKDHGWADIEVQEVGVCSLSELGLCWCSMC